MSIFSSQEFEADVPKRITLGLSLTDLEGVGFAENASTAVIVLLEGADNVTTDMPPTTEAPGKNFFISLKTTLYIKLVTSGP